MKQFNLPWHQSTHYWISIYPKDKIFPPALVPLIEQIGMHRQSDGSMAIRTERKWKLVWDVIEGNIRQADVANAVEVMVTAGEMIPATKAACDGKTVVNPAEIAGSMWVGDALLDDRIMCYLQPVMTAKGQVFGYESFARVRRTDGTVTAGYEIVNASKALGIEHTIDRHLHVQAITTFASSEFNGFLFVNFFPGFIHRPNIYLEGLSETAKRFGVLSKHIVLDFTKSETPHDLKHIKNVAEYSRSCGYSIAFDDITSVEVTRKLVHEVRPDFVKIDMNLVQQIVDPKRHEQVRTIVGLVHDSGGTVIAEGVESVEIYEILKLLGVDLFQGYLFSPPVPVEAMLKKSGS